MSAAPALSSEPQYARVEQQAQAPTVDLPYLADVYHVDQIARHIMEHDYQTPCLQFPDYLVRDSTHIAAQLQEKVQRPVYVLADTSYSPCCVDEIAAQHVKGDVVFHFGNACLNASRSLPAVYVSRKELNADAEAVINTIGSREKFILYADTNYTDLAFNVAKRTPTKPVVAIPASSTASFIPELHPAVHNRTVCREIPNRVLTERVQDFSDYDFIYLSDEPSESLLLHWSTVFKSTTVINGKGVKVNVNAALRRRYRYVQNIKAAGTIGILVNTLSLRDTASLLSRTKQAIQRAEKKYYMFVVGKPNVAKLGNFEVVDVWVILGCPQGGVIVNNDEYFKPIVTPYELELAFNDEWTGKWLLDFNEVLNPANDEENSKQQEQAENDDQADEEEPLFDLVTGKFVFNNTPLRQVSHLDLNCGGELQKSSNAVTVRSTVSTAAAKLQQRSWTGLGSDHADITEKYAELKKGRSGIARNYTVKE